MYTCSKLFDYLGTIVSYAALGGYILYMSIGGEDASVIAEKVSKGAFGTLYLINAFTSIFDMGNYASQVAGLWQRITPMIQPKGYLNREGHDAMISTPSNKDGSVGISPDAICMEQVTCTAPCREGDREGRRLFSDLSFKVTAGNSLVITGASGTGKTSILRLLGGLWPPDSGKISTPGHIGRGGMFFLPQRPYIRHGTLREQLIYPDRKEEQRTTDDELIELLRSVGLVHLMYYQGGLDSLHAWAEILSGGEQQRIGFCRMFYHEPKFGLMDESTNALDTEMEQKCMELCSHYGITMISVAHRPSLIRFHKQMLRLSRDADGTVSFVLD